MMHNKLPKMSLNSFRNAVFKIDFECKANVSEFFYYQLISTQLEWVKKHKKQASN